MTSSCHPLPWFIERVEKRIKRAPNNRKARGIQYGRKVGDPITIINKAHAEYLFMLQEEQGYRYVDFETIQQTVLP